MFLRNKFGGGDFFPEKLFWEGLKNYKLLAQTNGGRGSNKAIHFLLNYDPLSVFLSLSLVKRWIQKYFGPQIFWVKNLGSESFHKKGSKIFWSKNILKHTKKNLQQDELSSATLSNLFWGGVILFRRASLVFY